jgi:hypothetical protein
MEENKQRADKGVRRSKYKSTITPEYKKYLMMVNSNGFSIDYTEEEYLQIIRNSCYYCGSNNKIRITRIDMWDDYNPDNIRVCCGNCNMLKSHLNEREFLSIIKDIYKYQKVLDRI